MRIAGLQKVSLIDYPGKIAAIVFTVGCNFRCPFCYNVELVEPMVQQSAKSAVASRTEHGRIDRVEYRERRRIDLVSPKTRAKLIPEKEILDFFKKRQGLLEGVVITGGEPTLQADLEEFIKKVKQLRYLIKLDTNGTNPEVTKKLLANKLISYIAMDIKGPLDKYQKITGSKTNLANIKKSVEIIKTSGVDYEFRTTVVPTLLEKKDFVKIGHWLKGAKRYYLQQFRNQKTLDPKFQKIQPYPPEKLQEFAGIMKRYVKGVGIRGI